MTITLVEIVTDEKPADSDELAHFACCCSPEISLCLQNEGDAELIIWDGVQPACVVCYDLIDAICPRCGFSGSDDSCFCGKCC